MTLPGQHGYSLTALLEDAEKIPTVTGSGFHDDRQVNGGGVLRQVGSSAGGVALRGIVCDGFTRWPR